MDPDARHTHILQLISKRQSSERVSRAIARQHTARLQSIVMLLLQYVRDKYAKQQLHAYHIGRTQGSRNFRRGQSNWIRDYIDRNPTYPDYVFQRCFTVPRSIYFHIRNDFLRQFPDTWITRRAGFGKLGHPTDIKLLVCFRILATGAALDLFDDVTYMSEASIRYYFRQFVIHLMNLYGFMFFNRRPTASELDTVSSQYAQLGFPGCIGAVDCMHYVWKNCPARDKGQYLNSRNSKSATLQCEAWCDHDRYIWSWYSGRPGTNNDLNILAHSPLFNDIFNNTFRCGRMSGYSIHSNFNIFHRFYFLVDGIYPRWPIFVRPFGKYASRLEKNSPHYKRLLEKTLNVFSVYCNQSLEY